MKVIIGCLFSILLAWIIARGIQCILNLGNFHTGAIMGAIAVITNDWISEEDD